MPLQTEMNYCLQHCQIQRQMFFTKSFDFKTKVVDFPGGTVVKNLPANAGVMGSIPGPGTSHMPQSN